MWEFYDKIIDEIPDDLDARVDFIHLGEVWTIVSASGGSGLKYIGMAVTVNEQKVSLADYYAGHGSSFLDMPLKDLACYCESWDFLEASIGTAALNAYINSPDHLKGMHLADSVTNGFDKYVEVAAGKKVGIIGHFTQLERFLTKSDVYVIERLPQPGDYPDPACEYILPEMDYTFITGSSFINKTMPRLLQISRSPVILGPSTPMSQQLFDRGAGELDGFSPGPAVLENAITIGAGGLPFKRYGRPVSLLP